jgi:hypothetical protein
MTVTRLPSPPAGKTKPPKCYRYGTAGYWGYRAGVGAFDGGDPTVHRYPDSQDPWQAAYEHGFADALAGRVDRGRGTDAQRRHADDIASLRQVGGR